MEIESAIFWGSLTTLFVIFFLSISIDLEKRRLGHLKIFLFLVFSGAVVGIILSQEREVKGRFTSPRNLPQGSEWKTVFAQKGMDGRFEGFIKNLKSEESMPIKFDKKEEPPNSFCVGKLSGIIGFRKRELIPIKEAE